MRVIAGQAKSLRLVAPKGAGLRPTTDAMREALFSSLGIDVVGARFLDVYAGTGAVGIEALSRGAELCAFVERDRRCVEAIRTNLGNTRLSARATVVQGDARRVIGRVVAVSGPFGLVFMDPPYDDPRAAEVAQSVLEADWFAEPGWLILQYSKDAPPAGLPEPSRVRTFGGTEIAWYALPVKGA